MRLWIDTNDGAGEVEYTQAVRADLPLTITRRRGAWTECHAGLDLAGAGMSRPMHRSRVRVCDAAGLTLFQGFAVSDASAQDAFVSTAGAMDATMLHAVEPAWLTQAAPDDALQPVTAAEHAVALSDVALRLDSVVAPLSDLAADVTVAGGVCAAEYVTELFRGDGATASFPLQHVPFRESGSTTLVDDAFDGATLDAAMWSRVDVGSYLSLGSGGLRMNGGTGFDGAAVLQRTSLVEIGGSLIAEASGVMLSAGSDGVLLGFYDGTVLRSQCTAGIRVRGAAGAHLLVALINGVEQTTSYDFAAGHTYTMRVRLHCDEMQRVTQRYQVLVDGVLQQFGGDAVDAPLRVVIEVVDTGLASSTLPTVLYDGAMAVSPFQAVFAPVNSVALSGSMARVSLTRTGLCLVTTTATDGTVHTRRQGVSGTGADYSLTAGGMLTFAPGLLPQPGDLVMVRYRRGLRVAVRRVDETADFERVSLGLPGVPAWLGSVTEPAPRSVADCNAAAKALLALGAGTSTGVAGSVSRTRGAATIADLSPGDTLLVSSAEGVQRLPVTAVTLTDGNCDPECVEYTATFRQDRATSLGFHVREGLPEDAVLPVAMANDAALPAALQGLQVTVATTSALQVDAGVDVSDGWGFEVRRSDAHFGAADTADLVLRSPVRSFSVPRAAFTERFFVRMYDNALPPRYAAVSHVVVTSLPTG